MTSNVARGALLVQHEDGRQFRLSWGEEDAAREGKQEAVEESPPADAMRGLPAGAYSVRGYRLIREDEEDQRWFLSATGPELMRFRVRPGQTTRVEVPDRVALTHKAMRVRKNIKFTLGFQVLHHVGVSLYRGGVRVPLECSLLDQRDKVVASGTARYG